MVHIREQRVRNIENDIPDAAVDGPDSGRVLVIGWGSTHGAIQSAVRRVRSSGGQVSHVHLRHLNPMPRNVGPLLKRFEKVLVPELNLGQLASVLRSRFLVETVSLSKVQGKPFKSTEIAGAIEKLLEK
jgi:2-oxoglutarate ferredoxin oxidoreductase subunit alpha